MILLWVRELYPELSTKLALVNLEKLSIEDKKRPFWMRQFWGHFLMLKAFKPQYLGIDHEISSNLLSKYLLFKIPIVTWTVNNALRAQNLLQSGVYGIQSDEVLQLKAEGKSLFIKT